MVLTPLLAADWRLFLSARTFVFPFHRRYVDRRGCLGFATRQHLIILINNARPAIGNNRHSGRLRANYGRPGGGKGTIIRGVTALEDTLVESGLARQRNRWPGNQSEYAKRRLGFFFYGPLRSRFEIKIPACFAFGLNFGIVVGPLVLGLRPRLEFCFDPEDGLPMDTDLKDGGKQGQGSGIKEAAKEIHLSVDDEAALAAWRASLQSASFRLAD
ncbi:uncharacterized protein LOC143146080 [Ptiloglossa arizonensis]|uniref:uncharacterized protein LOC143146080 n=1 Tax=Ptiloglossa arizonensis TaxID=3350558 RepID=UPI003FA10453